MRTLTPIILLVVLLSAAFAPASGAAAPIDDLDSTQLDGIVAAQMQKHGLPGVALAVVEGGSIVYLQGYGTAGHGRLMSPQTQMFIGSQSKSFTALAIAQLAEQGRLDLDAPVQAYIPWFRVADEDASRTITISHLLHHTSGLSEAGYGVLLPPSATPEQATRSLARAQLTAPVGTQHQYFNLGYDVLAYLIQVVSGRPYADYLQDNIFAPLGMDDTTADPSTARDLAQGYSRLFGFAIPMRQIVRDYEIGAGYIVSTAEDLARFAIAVNDGGAGPVSPATMKRMLTPGEGAYGMGWMIVDGGAKIFHGGANETFRTDVNLYPRRDRAFVVLTNEGHQIDHFVSASQLAGSVEAAVLGRAAPPASQGLSVCWIGWGLGVLVLALIVLHTRNFLALRTWSKRARKLSTTRRALDVALSFLIPAIILVVVLSQLKSFYGYRFNLVTTLAYFRLSLPDVFILMVIGTVPDLVQGITKLILWGKSKGSPPGAAPAEAL
ncbi:MAG TPA: serine hydrolase domain-containing protein [Anaerolineae bacterium]|nr:serine hydrolase domain-containing protein [Anaerolineae bacterium]